MNRKIHNNTIYYDNVVHFKKDWYCLVILESGELHHLHEYISEDMPTPYSFKVEIPSNAIVLFNHKNNIKLPYTKPLRSVARKVGLIINSNLKTFDK